jgi:hypothetical protein
MKLSSGGHKDGSVKPKTKTPSINQVLMSPNAMGGDALKEEGEPDFIETNCHWIGCDRQFDTQDQLVKVSIDRGQIVVAGRPAVGDCAEWPAASL